MGTQPSRRQAHRQGQPCLQMFSSRVIRVHAFFSMLRTNQDFDPPSTGRLGTAGPSSRRIRLGGEKLGSVRVYPRIRRCGDPLPDKTPRKRDRQTFWVYDAILSRSMVDNDEGLWVENWAQPLLAAVLPCVWLFIPRDRLHTMYWDSASIFSRRPFLAFICNS